MAFWCVAKMKLKDLGCFESSFLVVISSNSFKISQVKKTGEDTFCPGPYF